MCCAVLCCVVLTNRRRRELLPVRDREPDYSRTADVHADRFRRSPFCGCATTTTTTRTSSFLWDSTARVFAVTEGKTIGGGSEVPLASGIGAVAIAIARALTERPGSDPLQPRITVHGAGCIRCLRACECVRACVRKAGLANSRRQGTRPGNTPKSGVGFGEPPVVHG